jgi:dolichyl-phosphate-mannose-protein mannosyltransferase
MWWTHHDLSAPVYGSNDNIVNTQTQQKPLMNGLFAEGGAWSWPLFNRGSAYYASKETNHYVYFMGNPVLWWTAAVAVGGYMFSCFWSVIKFLKGKQETKVERDRFGKTRGCLSFCMQVPSYIYIYISIFLLLRIMKETNYLQPLFFYFTCYYN